MVYTALIFDINIYHARHHKPGVNFRADFLQNSGRFRKYFIDNLDLSYRRIARHSSWSHCGHNHIEDRWRGMLSYNMWDTGKIAREKRTSCGLSADCRVSTVTNIEVGLCRRLTLFTRRGSSRSSSNSNSPGLVTVINKMSDTLMCVRHTQK